MQKLRVVLFFFNLYILTYKLRQKIHDKKYEQTAQAQGALFLLHTLVPCSFGQHIQKGTSHV